MAAEKVKERLCRAIRALDAAGIPYAVIGGNVVAEWVGRIDEDAVRNTKDVDLLIRRADFPAVQSAIEAVVFVYHHFRGVETFLDGPGVRVPGSTFCSWANRQTLVAIARQSRGLSVGRLRLHTLSGIEHRAPFVR